MNKHIILLNILLIVCGCTKNEGYKILGRINEYDNDYLFLYHHDTYDSTLVKNGEFSFEGSFEHPVPVTFATGRVSASDRISFIENGQIRVELNKEVKTRGKDFEYDWIIVEQLSGSKSDQVFRNYLNMKNENLEKDNKVIFSDLEDIFNGDYGNALSEQILFEEISDSILTINQLRKLYQTIKSKGAAFDTILDNKIVKIIYPERKIRVGEKIKDFSLIDPKGKIVSTNQLRGSIYLMEFWASWCKPCREEFPDLKSLYDLYRDKGFEVLGVSIDENRDAWINAIEKDELHWNNVISENGLKSEVPLQYNISAVPTNLLIDKEGFVIAKDISIVKLKVYLDNY